MPFFAATAAAAATPTSPLDQAISLPRKVNHLVMFTLLRCAQLSDLLLFETCFAIFKPQHSYWKKSSVTPIPNERGLHSRGFKRALKLEKLLNAAREAGMEGVAVKSGLSC